MTRRELALAIELRDALRRIFRAHSGVALPADELDAVNRALGRVVCDVSRARTQGTWDRLKLCPAEDCLWAFFDSSKNRSRRWCSMDVCGNRTKTREYRRRRAASSAGSAGGSPGGG